LRLGKVVAERFSIERLAGEGGMGSVYRGRDRQTGETVAIKVLHHPGTIDASRFAREAEVLAQLAHPGVVRYVAHGEEEGIGPYLVMEWLDGETLDARLERQELNLTETLALGMRAADALAVAHRVGVVHRDIKPSNLFLSEGDAAQAKLIDFGVARRFGFDNVGVSLTRPGAVIGTPGYMAPEQARGEHHLEPSADLFALGCVLYRCITGRVPFAGDNALAVLAKILLEEAPRPITLCPNLHPEVDELLMQMLCKDRKRRLSDASRVASTLARIPDSGDVLGTTLQGMVSPLLNRVKKPRRESITEAEQRLLCVVLGAEAPGDPSSSAVRRRVWAEDQLRETAEKHGARLERLADGSLVAIVAGAGAPTDLAMRAARCALALMPMASDLEWAVATGRGVLDAALPVGEAIDRAVKLLSAEMAAAGAAGVTPGPGLPVSGAAAGILLDDVTAALLSGRFALRVGQGATRLIGALEAVPSDPSAAAGSTQGKPTPFVGRNAELKQIQASLLDCTAESASQGVLLTGPPGIGKSRLCREILSRLGKMLSREVAQPAVLHGTADELRAGTPFGPLIEALRRAADLGDGEPDDARRAKVQRRFGQRATRRGQVAVLGELLGVPAGQAEEQTLGFLRAKPALFGDAVRNALLDWLQRETQERPLVLVIDDLHWADRPTVDFVRTSLRELAHRPLFVLLAGRPELRERFADLWSTERLTVLELQSLGAVASAELVSLSLGDGADDATVEALVERAAGNPFFLEELVRAQSEGRLSELPASILGTVEGLVSSLDPSAKQVLRAASVFGSTFWRAGVLELVGGPERAAMVDAALGTAIARGLVVASPRNSLPGDTEYVFRQGLVREAAYAMLTDDDRTLGHQLAAEWLSQHAAVSPVALAEHFARGGEPTRAADAFVRAAEQALDANDFDTALERIQAALSHGASGQQLAQARRLQAGALNWLGRHSEAHEAAWAAMNSVPSGSAAWFGSIEELLYAMGQRGDMAAFEMAERARAADPLGGALKSKLACLARSAVVLAMAGRMDQATKVVDELPRIAGVEALGELDQGRWHLARALIARGRLDLDRCLAEHAQAYAHCKKAQDVRAACLARLSHGSVLLELGRIDEAMPLLLGGLKAAQRLGAESLLSQAELALAEGFYRKRDLGQARQLAGQAAVRSRGHQELSLEGRAHVVLSRVALDEGNAALAEREGQTAARRLVGLGASRAAALAMQARSMVALTRHSAALALVEEALGYCDETTDPLGTVETLVRLVQIEALEASGDTAGARTACTRAIARLLERSSRLTGPEWQTRFLETVPENARTMALGQKYGRLGPGDDEITLR
jgi:tetratricopeptide (TPR) repeat protein